MKAPALVQIGDHNRDTVSRTVKIGAVITFAFLGLANLALIGLGSDPIAFLIGLTLAVLPVPLYLALALRIDRYEPEPLPMLAIAFAWGATGATLIALILNTIGQLIVGAQFGRDVGEIYGGSISAPIVEESAKALVLFALYVRMRTEFNGILDGIVYAAMVGLGFAMTENVLYYGKAAMEGGVPLALTFFVRGVISPFAHPLFTSMTGIGLGIAVEASKRSTRITAIALGLGGAIVLHAAWNTAAEIGSAYSLGAFLLGMVPVFIAVLVVAKVALTREAETVRRYLQPEVERGVLTGEDVQILGSTRGRRRALRAAKSISPDAARTMKAFQATATELAFQRHRNANGFGGQNARGAEEERLYAEELPRIRNTAVASGHGQGSGVPGAGWYADPYAKAHWRYWDGRTWTWHTA